MALRKTIFYFFFLLFYTACDSSRTDTLKENADFKVETVDVSACSEIPVPRQFAYFSYFISDTAFDTLVKPAPNPEYRLVSRGFIMYGGKNTTNGNVLNDLWLFDISNHETLGEDKQQRIIPHATVCPWVKLKAGVMDEPRWGGRMIYRYHDNNLMLIGGYKHNASKDESTSEILLMNLPRALSNDTQRSFTAGPSLSPTFTRLKVYGDTARHNIETFSDGAHRDDSVYESNLCNTMQPDGCLSALDDPQTGLVDEACMETGLPDINSCGPSVTRCGPLKPFNTVYDGCFFSPSCTLGGTDNNIDKDPNGLARFALLYNPLTNGAITFGGTEGCQGSSPACANWSRFDIRLDNPNPAVGRHELFSTAPFNSDKLSLMNTNNMISIDLASGNMATDNIAYRQSRGVNDFIKDFWPEGATMGLSAVSGTITGLRWNIRNGGWEINSTPTGLLVGGTFKQTIPPLYALDINEGPCFNADGCDQDASGAVEADETFYESPTLSCYQSSWYGHYQLFNNTPDEEYIHRVAKIDLNSPNDLRFTPLVNEVPPLINAEIVPFRFTSPNPRGGDDFIHDDFMLVGGSDVNGQKISHPMLIGEDPRSGAAVTRIVPDIGPRESVVVATDTLEQAVFVFGGSTDQTTKKISLKDHGLNRNNGIYHTTDAKLTYKLDDNGTATDTDDEWTIEAKYNLRFNCEPSTLCFADKIALHLLDSQSVSTFNTARVFATLPDDQPCNLPAPQGAPRGLPEPDNYCHELTVHTLPIDGLASITTTYKTAEWNLPNPIADGDEIELVVQYKPDFTIPLDSKYENFLSVGGGKFLMGDGALESKGYAFNVAPVFTGNLTGKFPRSYFNARDQFEKTDTFNLETQFILPANYTGIAPGTPTAGNSRYQLTNRNEFKNYKAHILENVDPIQTISDPLLTPGMEGQSRIHIYSQTNTAGHNELLNNYINCPTTPGEKYCLPHDLQRLQDTLGPYHNKDLHIIHMARHGNNNDIGGVTVNGVTGVLSYDEMGTPLVQNLSGPGFTYEQSVIVTHELCHNWFGSGVETDSWLREAMCQYIAELNYYLDSDGDAQDDTQFNNHSQNTNAMNSLLHASRGTEDCGIHEGVSATPYQVYLQGPYVMNQFYFAARGNNLLVDNSYTGYWQVWRNFLYQHRKTTVDSATLKTFMDTLLPPYVTATGQSRGGFYSDYVKNACRGIPLLTLREFQYNTAPGMDPTLGTSWYAPGSAGFYTVEQVQTTNFAPPGALSMGYFSYIPYYLSCSQSDDPFASFEQCYQIHVLKNDIETNPLTPTSFYRDNQIAPMPTMADIVQADRLSAMTIIDFYNRFYCGAFNQSYTAQDGSIVNCNLDTDSDSFREPEDCGMVYAASFDTNPNINSITEENLSTVGDVDCNCYTYDGANLSYGCGEHKPLPDDTEVIDLLAGLDLTPPEDLCVDIADRLDRGDVSRNQYCSCNPPQDTCIENYCGDRPNFSDYIRAGEAYADYVSDFQDEAEIYCQCLYENDVRTDAEADCVDLLNNGILPEDDCAVQFPLDGSEQSIIDQCTCLSQGDPTYDMAYCISTLGSL